MLQKEQKERIKASIILAAAGDAIGFNHGEWEFCYSGTEIMIDLKKKFGTVEKIPITNLKVSDDTIMHKGTIKALGTPYKDLDELMNNMVKDYNLYWAEMSGRAPGGTCSSGLYLATKNGWNKLPYNSRGGGCGGSMRAMAVGLKYFEEKDVDWLVKVGIESGRVTHNHVIGFMGSLMCSVFTSYAFKNIEPKKWGIKFLEEIMPRAKDYLKNESKRDWEKIEKDLVPFEEYVKKYLELRKISNGENEPVFPEKYDTEERDEQYRKFSHSGWGGSSGHDSVIIAYDSFLGAKGNWIELVKRSMLHGGDSDSTGTIAAAFYGAFYGYNNIPKNHYKNIEFEKDLLVLSENLIKYMEK